MIYLDENRKPTKVKHSTAHFMKGNPTKYNKHAYAVCTNINTRCFSLFQNGKGNNTSDTPISRYIHGHKELRTPTDHFLTTILTLKVIVLVLYSWICLHIVLSI